MTSSPDHSPFSSAFSGEGPRTGVVLSHGFTGSPHGLRAWAMAFAKAGFAVPTVSPNAARAEIAAVSTKRCAPRSPFRWYCKSCPLT